MVDHDRLSVLPNGVDVELWQPDAEIRSALRRELGLEDEFLWFAAGRLEPVKDYPALLGALAQTHHAARLVIAGRGPLEGELRRLATASESNSSDLSATCGAGCRPRTDLC